MAERRQVDYLLIGGGVASAACALTLRRRGAEGSVLLVGREQDLPYERPPLSKEYLRGEIDRAAALVHPESFYAEREIQVLTRVSVMKLNTTERVATLSNREEVGYGQALVATGANVRRLPVEGAQLDGLHYLRAFANSDGIRQALTSHGGPSGKRVVLIGGSYIACEVAASLTQLGVQCTMVMMEDTVLARAFGTLVGSFFQGVMEGRGVRIHGGESLARFEGREGKVERVVTQSGLTLDCDLVVLGAGVVPDVMLARSAGLDLGETGGVRCDTYLRTSAGGVFAAGDVAEWPNPFGEGRPVRIEHLDGAMAGGRTVALNMLGGEVPYAVVPYLWSELGDWLKVEMVGAPGEWDEEVIRGSLDHGEFSAWHFSRGRLLGVVSVGRAEDLTVARRAIEAGGQLPIPSGQLADLDLDIAAL